LIVKVIQFPDEEQNGIMHLIYLPRTSRANDGSLKYFLLSACSVGWWLMAGAGLF
jgi:hypothetical protein